MLDGVGNNKFNLATFSCGMAGYPGLRYHHPWPAAHHKKKAAIAPFPINLIEEST